LRREALAVFDRSGRKPIGGGALAGTLFDADAVILSDLHLGSPACQAIPLSLFLQRFVSGSYRTKELILNGDVFDSMDFRRLKKHHWKVLSLLRKLSDSVRITWVCGNHDGPSEIISHLLGVTVVDYHTVRSGRRSALVLHGHQFDEFVEEHPGITWLADTLYRFLQRIDQTHRVARFAKTNSKVFLRCAEKVRLGAVEYAREYSASMVCCGHTHHAEIVEGAIQYANSGSWTESPCTYLSVSNGSVRLHRFTESVPAESHSSVPMYDNALIPAFAN